MKSLLQSAALFSISLFLLASTARAGAITIVNAGFENDLSRVPNAGDYITNRQTTPNSQPFINGWTVLDVTTDITFAKYIGFFTPVSLTFTTGANPTGLGKPLLIAFGVPEVQTLFDDVHLDASPVGGGIPEPGSMSLLALGGVFVAYLKRK